VEKSLSRDTLQFKQVEIRTELAAGALWEEVQALLRFWRRRAYFAFVPAECPTGEVDYSIDLEHLAFALTKIRYYQELLDKRDRTVEVGQ